MVQGFSSLPRRRSPKPVTSLSASFCGVPSGRLLGSAAPVSPTQRSRRRLTCRWRRNTSVWPGLGPLWMSASPREPLPGVRSTLRPLGRRLPGQLWDRSPAIWALTSCAIPALCFRTLLHQSSCTTRCYAGLAKSTCASADRAVHRLTSQCPARRRTRASSAWRLSTRGCATCVPFALLLSAPRQLARSTSLRSMGTGLNTWCPATVLAVRPASRSTGMRPGWPRI